MRHIQNSMTGLKALFTCMFLLTGKVAVTVSKKIMEINGNSILDTILKIITGPVVILSYCC